MKIKSPRLIVVILAVLTGLCRANPHNIIIVTMYSADSERGYTEFLQETYRGNVQVHIDPNLYMEDLSDKKKLELESADLIIISTNNSGGSYNDDADFWNEVNVPILNHNIKLARSDGHKYWDWLNGNWAYTNPFIYLTVADSNDEIFRGVDTSSGTVEIFATGKEIDHSDQTSAGNGTVVATSNGCVAIARWTGTETSYYNSSDYAPGAPRLFFAMPKMTCGFFDDATNQGKLMLKNAILSLLPINRPNGDLDGDLDVDFNDFAIFSEHWMESGCIETSPCSIAELTGDANVTADDLEVLAENWLMGVDITAPEPNIMTWEVKPLTISTKSICMAATVASDLQNGVEYYFQCTSGNGPDSGWQYSNIFEPNNLTQGTKYTYRVKARDTSGHLNQSDWSSPVTARTFEMYRGMSDASAAAPLDSKLFIVADDEGNRLCIYDSNNPGSFPIAEPSIGAFLNIDPCQPETDIEGATWFNGRIFWITSHGRNKDGKYWYSRYQFFATTVTKIGKQIQVTVNGNYTKLVDDLIVYDSIYNLGLADAIGVKNGHIDPDEIPDLAPKEKGLNIEGLCATANGSSILIGFRNPRPDVGPGGKKALIIELYNPEEVVLDGAAPQFGPPILLDLGGFGIRSIEYSPTLGQYLLVAGSHKGDDEEPLQILYKYDMTTGILTKISDFVILTPEAVFQLVGSSDIYVLSDDGTLLVQTPQGPVQNKLLPREQRTFRTQLITP
ncbi:MAG: fibronectin type III domain-containing protein [Planctomycetota bacterium]|nr:fibronectin type III domain-containing protein [Planctomycetota bacterium]